MLRDLGWKGDRLGHPMCRGGVGVVRAAWHALDRQRREGKVFQVESSVCKGMQAGLGGHFQNSKQTHLTGTERRSKAG